MIDELREHYKQVDLLKTFNIERSSYNYHRNIASQPNLARERLKIKVKEIHAISRGAMGSRSISGKLKEEGEQIGRYKSRSLMRETNIESKQPSKRKFKVAVNTSDIADNALNRKFKFKRINQYWCGYVTYIWAGKQWLHLASVIDLSARRIIGWACSKNPDTELTKKALGFANEARGQPKGVIFHSDPGVHYTSKEYRQQLWSYRMKQSISRHATAGTTHQRSATLEV